jgi:hypothetical protein
MVPMTLREVKYLADSIELQAFIIKYSLKLKFINNEKILLISKCFVFEIYGLVVEDFFYFDLYPTGLNFYSNVDRLLSDFDSGKIQSVYQFQIKSRKKIAIPKLQGNEENTLRAEQYFFTMIQLMDELLEDVMFCKKKIGEKHCSEIFDYKKIELERCLVN